MKKKPSEPLIIGGKRYYKYKIIWEDIVGDSTLATENEFSNMTCAEVHTECWIFNKDVDYVVHAAALKHVPGAENNPMEFVKTNIYGAENIIQAAISQKVKMMRLMKRQ